MKPTYEELLIALENLSQAHRDHKRYGSEDDRVEMDECSDAACNLVARARAAEKCGA